MSRCYRGFNIYVGNSSSTARDATLERPTANTAVIGFKVPIRSAPWLSIVAPGPRFRAKSLRVWAFRTATIRVVVTMRGSTTETVITKALVANTINSVSKGLHSLLDMISQLLSAQI
jgi:hypothetical protein